MKYITMDVHTEATTVVIGNDRGKVLRIKALPTTMTHLREAVMDVRRPVTLVVEEGTLTGWLHRELSGLVDRFIACDPRYNRLVWQAEDKNDDNDPRRLLTLAVLDKLRPVYHTDSERYGLKELVLTYHRVTRDVARYRNRISAKCRQHGLGKVAREVYQSSQRKALINRLPWKDSQRSLRYLLSTFDVLSQQRDRLQQVMKRRAARIEPVQRFIRIPGVGPIIAMTVFAIVDTPFRFPDTRKLWKYAGLSVRDRSSMGVTLSTGASYQGCRWLKCAAMQAVVGALYHGDNDFAYHYRSMLKAGQSPHNARRTVARKILATIYGMWKSGEPYHPAHVSASRNL